MRRLRASYGATPLHLLVHLALLPLAAWALLQVVSLRTAGNVLLWLLAAVMLHDLVLLPAYSALDRAGQFATARLGPGAVNHVRVPAGLSALLLVVFWGVISGRGDAAYRRASGLRFDGYLERWLLASAALFAGSAVLYLLRARGDEGSNR